MPFRHRDKWSSVQEVPFLHTAVQDIHAVVRLTERGKQMYKMIVKNRPVVTSIDGDK